MDAPRLVAVGIPQSFRQHVARALALDAERVDWVPSATAAEGVLSEGREVDVLVVSPGVKEADAIGLAEFARRRSPFTSVVLVRDHMLDGSLPVAMRAGVRDVVDLSRGGEELLEALRRALEWTASLRSQNGHGAARAAGRRGRIVSVFSSKGGAGKTFLATNVAVAVAEQSGRDTAIVDLDFDMGDVFAYFGRDAAHSLRDLVTMDEGDRTAVLQAGTQLGPHLWGFANPPDPTAESLPGEAMGKVLGLIRASFDFVVVDATSDYSDHILAAFDVSDELLLVAALDVVSVRHLGAALQTLRSLGVPADRCRVVLNRADSKVDLRPDEVEQVLKVKVDAMVPSSRLVPMSLNRGRPLVQAEPRAPVSKSVQAIARMVVTAAERAATAAARAGGAGTPEFAAGASRRGLFSRR